MKRTNSSTLATALGVLAISGVACEGQRTLWYVSGGTGGTEAAGVTGGSSTGIGGTGGTFSGAGGTGTGGTQADPPDFSWAADVECDWQTPLVRNCAFTGCHNARTVVADLDLTPNADLALRLKDVPATHGDRNCGEPGQPFRECLPQEPQECVPFQGALLVDSASPAESFMLRKLLGTHGGCGDEMPIDPGNSPSREWSEERRECLLELVYALAAAD